MKDRKQRNKTTAHAQFPDPYLEVGRIVRPHGIRGQVILASDSQFLTSLPPGTTIYVGSDFEPLIVETIRRHQDRYLLLLQSITTREEAETLRNKAVFLDMSELPDLAEDEYYYWQLIGLRVEDTQNRTLGTLKEILETGANDVYILESSSGSEILIPAIKDVIKKIDLDQGLIQIDILPGLLPDPDKL
ncbi:MAG: 16S rRNA processing protein RimM [Anaerolineales bacterium]|nr:16S rRNA processing protein RimM [Anaerolineales bacterium]